MYKKIKQLKNNTDTEFILIDKRKCHKPDSVITSINIIQNVFFIIKLERWKIITISISKKEKWKEKNWN